ncbi:MAG: serpin family protein [Oscillospiraceae bacterium]
MKRIFSLLLACILSVLVMAGCSANTTAANLTGNIKPQTIKDSAITPAQLKAALLFSENLFSQSLKQGEENMVLSPLSAYYALALTANGANGDTAKEFEEVLGLSSQDANALCHTLQDILKSNTDETTLSFANSVWMNEGFEANNEFLQNAVDYFAADVYSLPFKEDTAANTINQWVSEKTDGLIPDMVDEISPEAVMLLYNTLYMDAKWTIPFDAKNTYDGVFTLQDGSTVKVPFLSASAKSYNYINTTTAEGILVPYKGSNLCYLAIKPKDGNLDSIQFVGSTLQNWLKSATYANDVVLSMPKYEAAFTMSLNDVLKPMGLTLAFEDGSADLQNLGSYMNRDLFITNVQQRILIRVDEEGTEAAAVTEVEVGVTSAPFEQEPPLILTFDSAYFYAVVDMETGLPLFMGVMSNPSAAQIA